MQGTSHITIRKMDEHKTRHFYCLRCRYTKHYKLRSQRKCHNIHNANGAGLQSCSTSGTEENMKWNYALQYLSNLNWQKTQWSDNKCIFSCVYENMDKSINKHGCNRNDNDFWVPKACGTHNDDDDDTDTREYNARIIKMRRNTLCLVQAYVSDVK